MPTEFVVDASAAARLFLEDRGAPEFRAWYLRRRRERHRFHAPDLLPYELTNILHRERGRSSALKEPDYAVGIVRDVLQGIHLDETAWARTWRWADRLSAYDAAYLGLAFAKDATLVTYDHHLSEVAREIVPVLGIDGL